MEPVLRHPNRADWDDVRPVLEELRRNQQTVPYMVRHLRAHSKLRVTNKMVSDRLKEWRVAPKYQRNKQLQSVSRAVSTPQADVQINATLSCIGSFLDSLLERYIWPPPSLGTGIEFQQVTADALMAISSTTYDTRAVWTELRGMDARVDCIVKSFTSHMHPRVLSVLLRVLVQNPQLDQVQRATIRSFRAMLWRKATDTLQASHPVSALCALDLPPERIEDFLEKFTTQLDSRLYGRIRDTAPDFVAQEMIYTARALASLGVASTADGVLESAATLSMQDVYTQAEYHRTVGFSHFHKDVPTLTDAALEHFATALHKLQSIDKGSSVEAMYVHYITGSAYRRKHVLESAARHMEAALRIWEMHHPTNQQRGGIGYVLDLHDTYKRLGWGEGMQRLQDRYAPYFEESQLVEGA